MCALVCTIGCALCAYACTMGCAMCAYACTIGCAMCAYTCTIGCAMCAYTCTIGCAMCAYACAIRCAMCAYACAMGCAMLTYTSAMGCTTVRTHTWFGNLVCACDVCVCVRAMSAWASYACWHWQDVCILMVVWCFMMCACACNGLCALRKCAMYTAHVYRHMITGAIRFCNLKMCHWCIKGACCWAVQQQYLYYMSAILV